MNKKIVNIVVALIIVSALCAIICWGVSAPQEEAGNATLQSKSVTTVEIITPTIDLGTFHTNEVKEDEYIICNTGSSPLIILKVVSSCNCTKIKYPQKPIPPGDTCRIKVVYTPNSLGKFNKAIDLHTNTRPQLNTLRIRGTIVK